MEVKGHAFSFPGFVACRNVHEAFAKAKTTFAQVKHILANAVQKGNEISHLQLFELFRFLSDLPRDSLNDLKLGDHILVTPPKLSSVKAVLESSWKPAADTGVSPFLAVTRAHTELLNNRASRVLNFRVGTGTDSHLFSASRH
jgi:hypothetical protein